jgi:translation initiation factor IF-1
MNAPDSQQHMASAGVVEAVLPNDRYAVRLERSGRLVTAHLGGRTRTDLVRVIPGDAVLVELSSLDPSRARIVGRPRA